MSSSEGSKLVPEMFVCRAPGASSPVVAAAPRDDVTAEIESAAPGGETLPAAEVEITAVGVEILLAAGVEAVETGVETSPVAGVEDLTADTDATPTGEET